MCCGTAHECIRNGQMEYLCDNTMGSQYAIIIYWCLKIFDELRLPADLIAFP